MPSIVELSAVKSKQATAVMPVPARISLSDADLEWVATGTRVIWRRKALRTLRTLRDPGVAVPAAVLLFIVLAC
ncbi:MAG: hypothetical protein KGI75_28590, partial [Rhizobiaceae bacterium]|nr:hypothetical protein [Rhizobiaceae bacterium]